MPYKTDKLKLDDPFFKKSSKLIPCQREMIKVYYQQGASINSLAKRFNVSKRLIQFELFPERHQKNLQDRDTRGGTMIYYDKEAHRETMKKHRQHKHALLKSVVQ